MTIEEFYGNRTAKRSGVPLINHINEGTRILEAIEADPAAILAYRLHPMYQNDYDLEDNYFELVKLPQLVVVYVMEYRNIANASLSDIVFRNNYKDWCPLELRRQIKISPLEQVNKMLVADKVQNWKDFKQFHKGKHERSEELDLYFRSWFKALGISEGDALYLETFCETNTQAN